jgi:hypothetical protein
MFRLSVGGTLFYTSRHTLMGGSDFFAAALGGAYAESVDAAHGEAFFVDRSPKTFDILLEYMRSGVLLCSDRSMLAGVLLEAEYFLMNALLEEVKWKCYINLYLPDLVEGNLSASAALKSSIALKILGKFPDVRMLIQRKDFPNVYYEAYANKIISTTPLPGNSYVELTDKISFTKVHFEATHMVTYQRSDTLSVIMEPMVHFGTNCGPWTNINFFESPHDTWPKCPVEASQLAPISFVVRAVHGGSRPSRPRYAPSWNMLTKEFSPILSGDEEKLTCTFSHDIDGSEDKKMYLEMAAGYQEYLTYADSRREIKGYSFNAGGRLMEMSQFSNFVHLGSLNKSDTQKNEENEE